MTAARKTKLPAWAKGHTLGELVAIGCQELMEAEREIDVAKLRRDIIRTEAIVSRACAGALAALADPLHPKALERADLFDRLFWEVGTNTEETTMIDKARQTLSGALWMSRHAEAVLLWGDETPPECSGLDPEQYDFPRCGYPVKKGEQLCWHCTSEASEQRGAA